VGGEGEEGGEDGEADHESFGEVLAWNGREARLAQLLRCAGATVRWTFCAAPDFLTKRR
jgi:hypothetical protein